MRITLDLVSGKATIETDIDINKMHDLVKAITEIIQKNINKGSK